MKGTLYKIGQGSDLRVEIPTETFGFVSLCSVHRTSTPGFVYSFEFLILAYFDFSRSVVFDDDFDFMRLNRVRDMSCLSWTVLWRLCEFDMRFTGGPTGFFQV